LLTDTHTQTDRQTDRQTNKHGQKHVPPALSEVITADLILDK